MLLGFYRKGYRDGVRIVDSDPKLADQFFCPYVEVTPDTKLEATVVKLNPPVRSGLVRPRELLLFSLLVA